MDASHRPLAAAEALRRAQSGPRPADLPADLIPQTEAEAYRIQDLVIGDQGIAGWKVAAMPSASGYSCAALSAGQYHADGADFRRGDCAPEVEVEIAIRMATDLPPRSTPYSRAEVLAALGTAHAAYEILQSRFENRRAAAKLSVLADAQSSGGFGIGTGTEGWQGLDFTTQDVALIADGAVVAAKTGYATADQTVDALVWLANHASARGTGLRTGQFVITGARLGPVPVPQASRVTARVAGIGEVTMIVV